MSYYENLRGVLPTKLDANTMDEINRIGQALKRKPAASPFSSWPAEGRSRGTGRRRPPGDPRRQRCRLGEKWAMITVTTQLGLSRARSPVCPSVQEPAMTTRDGELTVLLNEARLGVPGAGLL